MRVLAILLLLALTAYFYGERNPLAILTLIGILGLAGGKEDGIDRFHSLGVGVMALAGIVLLLESILG